MPVKVTDLSTRFSRDVGSSGVVTSPGTGAGPGGDVSGSLSGDITVTGIGGIPVDVSGAADGYVLTYVAASTDIEFEPPGGGGGPSNPITGVGNAQGAGGELDFNNADAFGGGSAGAFGGAGAATFQGGSAFIVGGSGDAGGNPGAQVVAGAGSTGSAGLVTIFSGNSGGAAGDFLFSDGFTDAVWGPPTVRVAAGVPSGAPTAGELPIAADTTAITGGLYAWDGASWVKVSSI